MCDLWSKPLISFLFCAWSQLAEWVGAGLPSSLHCALTRLCWGQVKRSAADVLEGRDGEVVDHGVQHAVEIGQTDGDVECVGQFLHGVTDFRFGAGSCHLTGLEPNHHLRDVAREEAGDEEHHHQCDEAQSLLDLCMLGQLSASEVGDHVGGAVENHKQRQVEGKEKLKLVPVHIGFGVGVHHEAFTVRPVGFGRWDEMGFQEDVCSHRNGDEPDSKCY